MGQKYPCEQVHYPRCVLTAPECRRRHRIHRAHDDHKGGDAKKRRSEKPRQPHPLASRRLTHALEVAGQPERPNGAPAPADARREQQQHRIRQEHEHAPACRRRPERERHVRLTHLSAQEEIPPVSGRNGLTTRGRRRRVRLAQIDVAREVGVEGVGVDEESVGGWREAHEDVER